MCQGDLLSGKPGEFLPFGRGELVEPFGQIFHQQLSRAVGDRLLPLMHLAERVADLAHIGPAVEPFERCIEGVEHRSLMRGRLGE
jgi:hypothetical protein